MAGGIGTRNVATAQVLGLGFCLAIAFLVGVVCGNTCHADQLQLCVNRADRLLKNPESVFPDTPVAVDRLCRTWSNFTQCVQEYTKRCLNAKQKLEFDRTFKDPVASMSVLCTNTPFRSEYLLYAPCIKKIAIEEKNCGFQYKLLIDYMSEGVNGKKICCARNKFQKCVLTRTRSTCDVELNKDSQNESSPKKNATAFAELALNKSLGTMPQQCQQIGFSEEDCPGKAVSGNGPNVPHDAPDNTTKPAKPPVIVRRTTRKTTEKPKEKQPDNLAIKIGGEAQVVVISLALVFINFDRRQ